MRRLKTTEVLKLDSFSIIPGFAQPPSKVTVEWPHATVTLTLQGTAYLIEWGDGQSQRVLLHESNHTRRYMFSCPSCSVPFEHLYFDGYRWGCFHCLDLGLVPNQRSLSIAKTEEKLAYKEHNKLINDLSKLL